MLTRAGRRLTYANVVSTLALFIVIGGGTALASLVITSNHQVGPNTISGHRPPSGDHSNIIGGSVATGDLAAGAVQNGQLASGAVTGAKVTPGSLTGSDLNVSSVLKTIKLDRPVDITQPTVGGNTHVLARIGPFTLTDVCFDNSGGAGTAVHSEIDINATGPYLLASDTFTGRYTFAVPLGETPNPSSSTAIARASFIANLAGSTSNLAGQVMTAVDFDGDFAGRSGPVCVSMFNGSGP